jgi:hypothetical protein
MRHQELDAEYTPNWLKSSHSRLESVKQSPCLPTSFFYRETSKKPHPLRDWPAVTYDFLDNTPGFARDSENSS